MEVSAGLRQPPAAAASFRARRSVALLPRPASPSPRPVSRAVKVDSPSSPLLFRPLAMDELSVSLESAGLGLTYIRASAIYDLQKSKSNLEALFCYDKSVPEEDIGKPDGLNVEKKNVGNNPPCSSCEAKGAVLCATCAGSGLYVDSILESQGIIIKVRCLGCGGTGNIMCSKCGGRGHT
ncbi:hypothetical protein EJB05_05339, partial [Eragrostis curvula]